MVLFSSLKGIGIPSRKTRRRDGHSGAETGVSPEKIGRTLNLQNSQIKKVHAKARKI